MVYKPISEFSGKKKLHNYCKPCSGDVYRQWVKENQEARLEYKKQYNQMHKEAIQRYYKENKEKISVQHKEYYYKHKTDIRNRNDLNEKIRLKVDINFKLRKGLRTRLCSALKRNEKRGSAVRDLGCSIDFLKQYLSTQFDKNMSWNNYGAYWEIDHITPLSRFDLTNRDQLLKAVHYTNLQPLTVSANRRKGAN
jgi:hypothetical protein